MFIGNFFRANPNFSISETLRDQAYLENNMVIDWVRELIIFKWIHIIHVFRSIFHCKPEFCYFENTYSHPEGPGVLWEIHGHGIGQGIYVILELHLFPQDCCKCFQNSTIQVFLEKLRTKTYQLPDLNHDHVDLNVHLYTQDGLESL